jgi:hypothetical protein
MFLLKTFLYVFPIFLKFDRSWKMKVWHSLWYHPIILSPIYQQPARWHIFLTIVGDMSWSPLKYFQKGLSKLERVYIAQIFSCALILCIDISHICEHSVPCLLSCWGNINFYSMWPPWSFPYDASPWTNHPLLAWLSCTTSLHQNAS